MAKSVPLEVLQKHAGVGPDGSYWTALHGKVYDFTAFVKKHPGGPKIIKLAAGRDATILFESHHLEKSQGRINDAIKNDLKYIGDFVDGAAEGGDPTYWITLRKRVDEKLKSLNMSMHYGTNYLIAEAAACAAFFLFSTYQVSIKGNILWAVPMGLVKGRLGFLMHSGNHCSASRSKLVNALIGLCMNLIGGSSFIWRYQHQVTHHMYPNDPHRDKDVHSGAPLIRLHPQHKRWFWHNINLFATASMMSGFMAKWFVSDVFHTIRGKMVGIRIHVTPLDVLGLLATKAQWVFLHVYVPYKLFGPRYTARSVAIFMSVGAYYLGGTFIVNHIQEGLVADPTRHWAERQVLASANYSARSFFVNWASGGLNHQIEHHLFPSMSIYCYPYIQQVVEDTSKEFGITYRNYSSYWTALFSTVKYLYKLGQHKLAAL